ncbi:hypothetical protein BG000_008730 [Podila horticola]|nr:hypothetical protein BG000_008730 [Podila horticola]
MAYDDRSCVRRHKWKLIILTVLLIVVAVAVPLAVIKPWDKSKDNITSPPAPVPIKPNQTITPSTDDSAKPNAYTPALNEPFDYTTTSKTKIRGVNLGGWLVLEPFITPSLFNPYTANGVIDEYTLCKHLGPAASKTLLEKHYATWVTEDTFKRIRDLGLNHVRIPIGFWALGGLKPDEPYVPDVAWTYLLQGIEWARKYGIRVMVELHAAPGSQNGWNHSGRSGAINWINGTEGAENAQRTIPYLTNMATFFSGPAYAHVSPIMGLLNEPAAFIMGGDKVKTWYTKAFDAVRAATGQGKGPWAVIHDGMLGLSSWADFMPKADRMMLDTHLYIMFDDNLMRMNTTAQLKFACETWGSDITASTAEFGPTMVGEFSVAVNDCATYLNGVNTGNRWEGTWNGAPKMPGANCANENNAATYTPEYKLFLKNFFLAQIEAYEQGSGWTYWNFKTETNPLWSYFDGVDGGWLPKDANNRGPSFCASQGYAVNKPRPVQPDPILTTSTSLTATSTGTTTTGTATTVPTKSTTTSTTTTTAGKAVPTDETAP